MGKIITLTLLLFQSLIFSQIKKSDISSNVIQLFNTADSVALNYDSKKGFTKNYSTNEIKYLTKKYYKAIADSPIDFRKYMEIKYNEWAEKFVPGKRNDYKPAFKILLIKDLISKEYGEKYTKILGIPYILRIKVLEQRHGEYISSSPQGYTIPKTIYVAEIQDIIKGSQHFNIGDTINVNVLYTWVNIKKSFLENGKAYIIPLRPFNCLNGSCEGIALDILPDSKQIIYPINEDTVNIQNDFFEFGKHVNPGEFKKLFQEKYTIK